MKYNFIFDKEFLGNRLFNLSVSEFELIRVIINGGHNACIRGYKPERIVGAIKAIMESRGPVIEPPYDIDLEHFCGGGPEMKMGSVSLADNGLLVMKHLEKFHASVISITPAPMENGNIRLCRSGEDVVYPAKFQLLATLSDEMSRWHRAECILNRCEIDFNCRAETPRSPYSLSSISDRVTGDWNNHLYITARSDKNQVVNDVNLLSFTTEAKELYEETVKTSYTNPIMIARLARSIADMRCHSNIRTSDIETAKTWHTPIL